MQQLVDFIYRQTMHTRGIENLLIWKLIRVTKIAHTKYITSVCQLRYILTNETRKQAKNVRRKTGRQRSTLLRHLLSFIS